jgi:hypothetical protein
MGMKKTSFAIKLTTLFTITAIGSCSSIQSDKRVADTTKVAVEMATDSSKKTDSPVINKKVAHTDAPLADDSKEKKITNNKSKKTEKNSVASDSFQRIKPTVSPVSKHENATPNTTVPNPSPVKPASTDAGNRPFVSKYGIIPRDANESNLTVFFNTFPGKSTLIKVNFDGPADDEMNIVKTQIIKVLRKSGYINVIDHSEIIEPKQIPKEIHYELQHDGSVVFWVPPANPQ